MGISNWFRSRSASRPSPSEPRLDERLAVLERESERADPGFQWGPLNRAGDLCLRAGDKERALRYYGRTIDTLLRDGQREAARGVANKIIRVHPEAVRTLCTLTWLDLAAGHMATALLHLRDYMRATVENGDPAIAMNQVMEMARIFPDAEFLGSVADALDGLNASEKAGVVREWQRAGGSPDALHDAGERSEACLQRAIESNTRTASG